MAQPPPRRRPDPDARNGRNQRQERRERRARRQEAEAAARAARGVAAAGRSPATPDGPIRHDVDAEQERIPVAERWAVARHAVLSFLWPPQTRRLSKGRAVVVLVLNIAPLPGLGTALYGKWERGLAQFLFTFLFLLGWFWAILDGIHVVRRSFEAGAGRRQADATAE